MSTTLDSELTRASLLRDAGDPANQKAQAAFAEHYGGLIRKWCRKRRLQDADQDDVAQTILCKLIEMLPTFKYDQNKRFGGLLRTMIHHAIVDIHRKRQRQPGGYGSGDTGVRDQLGNVLAPDDESVEGLAQALARCMKRDQRIREACERVRLKVKPHTWKAFWLTTIEGEPAAVVAERLGMAKGTVPVAKYRVAKMIQSEVAGMDG